MPQVAIKNGVAIIPQGTKIIEDDAFFGCSGLTSVTIPDSVTSIGRSAFEGCTALTSVTIPDSVASIGRSAFEGCTALTSVTIPDSVTSIGDYAFSGCSGLTSVHISDIAAWCNIDFDSNPLEYAHHLYLNGEEVKDLVIPNSVTSIEYSAFEGCTALTSVTIPNSVTSIRYGAFHGCSGLTSIVVEEGNAVYDSRNNCNAIIKTESNTLLQGCNTTIIPDSVTSIEDDAFVDCESLTSITIPNSVTSIGDGAFFGCSGLTSVTIPNSVTSIGDDAFYNCDSLTSINIPEGTTEHFKKILPEELHDLMKEVEVKNGFDPSQVYDGPQYHCVLAGQSFGPVTISQFANMKRFGIVDGNTLVWKEGMANWAIASTIADLQILI